MKRWECSGTKSHPASTQRNFGTAIASFGSLTSGHRKRPHAEALTSALPRTCDVSTMTTANMISRPDKTDGHATHHDRAIDAGCQSLCRRHGRAARGQRLVGQHYARPDAACARCLDPWLAATPRAGAGVLAGVRGVRVGVCDGWSCSVGRGHSCPTTADNMGYRTCACSNLSIDTAEFATDDHELCGICRHLLRRSLSSPGTIQANRVGNRQQFGDASRPRSALHRSIRRRIEQLRAVPPHRSLSFHDTGRPGWRQHLLRVLRAATSRGGGKSLASHSFRSACRLRK